MQCIKVLLGTFIFVTSISAFAETQSHSNNGLSIGSNGLSIRKDLSEATQIYTSVHLADSTDFSSGGNQNSYWITLGLKRHLYTIKLSDRFSTYIDAALVAGYRRSNGPGSSGYTNNKYSAGSAYVIEYFLAPNLNITAEVGLEINYYQISDQVAGSFTIRNIVFPTTATALTYYW